MKTTLYLFIFFLALSYSCTAQLNELTDDELFGIQFNTITLGDIMEIQGHDNKATALFGEGNFESALNESCPFLCKYFYVYDKKVYFSFEDVSETGDEYFFAYLAVNDPSVKVTVKNVTVSLGDNINVFNGHKINVYEENRSVVFIDKDTNTISLSFTIDNETNEIAEIEIQTF